MITMPYWQLIVLCTVACVLSSVATAARKRYLNARTMPAWLWRWKWARRVFGVQIEEARTEYRLWFQPMSKSEEQ